MAENQENRQADEVSLGEDKESRAHARIKRNLKRGQKKNGKFFNLFDLFVIFVVLVALTLLVLGVRVSDIFGAGDEGRACRVEYQVRFEAIDESFADKIKLGEALYDVDTKADMGRVAAEVTTTQTVVILPSTATDGASVEGTPLEGKVDMVVTVSVDAVYVRGVGYTVAGRPLRVGEARTLRFPGYVGTGVCTSLRELNTAQ